MIKTRRKIGFHLLLKSRFWIILLLGILLFGIRWTVLYFVEDAARSHLPSLILAAILIIIGFQTWLFGLFAVLVATNRKLLEENRIRLLRLELQ